MIRLGLAENPHSGFIGQVRTHPVGFVVMMKETWQMMKMMGFNLFSTLRLLRVQMVRDMPDRSRGGIGNRRRSSIRRPFVRVIFAAKALIFYMWNMMHVRWRRWSRWISMGNVMHLCPRRWWFIFSIKICWRWWFIFSMKICWRWWRRMNKRRWGWGLQVLFFFACAIFRPVMMGVMVMPKWEFHRSQIWVRSKRGDSCFLINIDRWFGFWNGLFFTQLKVEVGLKIIISKNQSCKQLESPKNHP